MFYSKNGETIISVIMIVAIISIVLISLVKIVSYDNELSFQYDKTNYISLIQKNTNSLIQKINTSALKESDIFYIYKTGSSISVMTGSQNSDLKYINFMGENVNSGTYLGAIYSRFCLVDKDTVEGQMIKCSIKELIRK